MPLLYNICGTPLCHNDVALVQCGSDVIVGWPFEWLNRHYAEGRWKHPSAYSAMLEGFH